MAGFLCAVIFVVFVVMRKTTTDDIGWLMDPMHGHEWSGQAQPEQDESGNHARPPSRVIPQQQGTAVSSMGIEGSNHSQSPPHLVPESVAQHETSDEVSPREQTSIQPSTSKSMGSTECHWDFPVSQGRPLDFFAQNLLELITFVATLLNRHNITHYVRRGTLLGIYRHRAQIPFLDNDMDLSIANSDYERAIKVLKAEMDHSRFRLKLYHAKPPFYQMCVTTVYKRCHKYHQKFNMLYYLYPWQLDLNPDLEVATCKCRYYNISLNCPLDTEARLQRLYGRGFRSHPMCKMRPDLCRMRQSAILNDTWAELLDVSRDPPGPNATDLTDVELIKLHVFPFRRLSSAEDYCTHPLPNFPGFNSPARWNRPFIKTFWGSGLEPSPIPSPRSPS